MAKIKSIVAREILNAKGLPTVEATVVLNDNSVGIASCPSGTSVSSYEAVELKDHDQQRFHGFGVLHAVNNVASVIAPALVGTDASKQQDIDKKIIELDGTINKAKLGANATLSVSMAIAKAAAKSAVMPLFLYLRQFVKTDNASIKMPTPMFNLINGGKHASGRLDFQEFMVIPATSKNYSESLSIGANIYYSLGKVLSMNNMPTLTGDEGGYAPLLNANSDAFFLLKQAIDANNLRLDYDVFFGLDAASNSFFENKEYVIKDRPNKLNAQTLLAYYKELNEKYHLLYLEDPFAEDDWEGWEHSSSVLSQDTIVTGDDLTATNPFRLQNALDKKAISGIIIKPNQIGTVIEALAVVEVARLSGLKIVVSHRSGETNDDFIADFAVAVGADYAKFGAPARGERVAKYNRLLQIESHLKVLGTTQR